MDLLDLPTSHMYASVGVTKLDDKNVFGMSTVNGDGLHSYDMVTGETTPQPGVTTVSRPQF